MAGGTLLGFMTAASTLGLMSLAGWFISASASAGLIPSTVHLFNHFVPGAGLRLLALLRTICRYGERVTNHDSTLRILEGLRVWFFSRLEPLGPAVLWSHGRGHLLNQIVSDIDAMDAFYPRIVSPSVVALMISVLTFVFLLFFHGEAAFYIFLILMVAACGTPFYAAMKGAGMAKETRAEWANLRSRVVEGIHGLAELTVLGGLRSHREEVMRSQSALIETQRRLAFIRGGTNAFLQLLSMAGVLLLISVLSSAHHDTALTGPLLAGLVLGILAAFEAIFPLPAAHLLLGRVREAGHQVMKVATLPPAVTFPISSVSEPRDFSVQFHEVTFLYKSQDPPALKNVTFHMAQGQRTAIVGESGAGKSSLAHLLVRFFDPQEGKVTLGGADIRSLSEKDLRRYVVVLSQQSHLFYTSIRENLLMACPEADEGQLHRALEWAKLAPLVKSLPQGLDTHVGEWGQLISAGQGRRLALARAILRDAPIWVLDEPTEGLDRQTERELVDSLLQLTRERTVLWITHRLTDLHRMNQVVFMEGGRITGKGSHEGLLATNPHYRLWCAQAR